MQQLEKEKQSWIKLSVLLTYIIGFGLLNVFAGDGDIGLNLDDSNVINLLKILQAVSVIILFILPAVLFATLWTKPRIHYLGITTQPQLGSIILAALGMLLALPAINWLSDLNQQMKLPEAFSGMEVWMKNSESKAEELTEAFTKGTSAGVLILNLFVIAFMAAISEEIFFRGILQKVLIECTKNKHVGVWIGAILFSAFHVQFYGFVPRMLMGAYLGYLFLWSGSLWLGIFAHFINNGLAVFLVWLVNRGEIISDPDKIGIEENQWLFVLISLIMVAITLVLVYKMEKKKKEEISAQSDDPTI